MDATALIAEDEPLLAQALAAELARAWPALRVLATVGNGASAVEQALGLRPQVLFLDIRMPGLSGLEAAADLADQWPVDRAPFPALVFVTAYDEYAVQAFDAQAVDYIVKPVRPERLARTVARLQERLAARQAPGPAAGANTDEALFARLRTLLAAADAAARPEARMLSGSDTPASDDGPLRVIQVGAGSTIRMVPVEEVIAFEAADKYVRVLTPGHEWLIRTPLKELLPRLDGERFWQVHRGTVVRADAIESVTRDEAGRLHLALRGMAERFAVSRLYAHRFRAM